MAEANGQGKVGSARCIVWHERGSTIPEELLESLARRDVYITSCTSAFSAMGLVCRHERAGGGDAGGGSSPDPLVLLLVFPANLPLAAEVVWALKRYAPRTACWCYEAGANQALRAVVESDVTAWSKTRTAPATPPRAPLEPVLRNGRAKAPSQPPTLRLAGQMDATDGTSDNPVPPREVWAGMGFGVEGTNPFITRAPSGPPTHTGSATNAVGPQPPAPSRNGVRLVNADAPAGAIPAAGLLTDEELAMLLHDEPLPEKTQTPGEANG